MTEKSRKPTDKNPNTVAKASVLSESELNAISAGTIVGLGLRKSAGGNTSGAFFR